MKWKNLGLALVGLVLPSWSLMAQDNSNPMAQPPPWRTPAAPGQATEGPVFSSNNVVDPTEVRRLASCEESPRQEGGTGEAHPPTPPAQPARLEPWPERADGTPPRASPPSDPSNGPAPMPPKQPDGTPLSLLHQVGNSAGGDPLAAYCAPPYSPVVAGRLGWWFTAASGSPTKVVEYEGLGSSPFADVDGLFSNGARTVNFFGTNLDNESSQVGVDYFAGHHSADVDFQRYPHRLEHDPLTNMGDLHSGQEVIREDLNVGEDYAVRVEEITATFKGRLTDGITARLKFHSLRKFGERQANAVTHCFGEPPIPPLPPPTIPASCHVLSQRQGIDWQTVKVEPVIEANFGPVRVEYSRPMRFFGQDDQVVLAEFFELGPHFPVDRAYAFVPDSVAQTDRVKLSVDLGGQTNLYARLSAGDTEDKFRQTHRNDQGYDVRLTNRTWDRLTLTGFITANKQSNEFPPFFLPEEALELSVPNAWIPPYGIGHPVDYSTVIAGAETSWQPFGTEGFAKGLLITAGWEAGSIHRRFADYHIEDLRTFISEEHTPVSSWHIGPSMRFSSRLDTYVRYKQRSFQDPLFGVNLYEGATNTNLPKHEQVVETGGTWRPYTNVSANATVGIASRTHHSDIADFDETSFPVTFSLWYAPAPRWSLSAGCGLYSNQIEQDILFPSDTPLVETWNRSRWDYGGRFSVLSFGTTYAWTEKITLSGGSEFVAGRDAVDPLPLWPDLSQDFDVIVDRTRVTAGIDWQLRERISAYGRYRFEEYADRTAEFNSGAVHMFLAGLSAVY